MGSCFGCILGALAGRAFEGANRRRGKGGPGRADCESGCCMQRVRRHACFRMGGLFILAWPLPISCSICRWDSKRAQLCGAFCLSAQTTMGTPLALPLLPLASSSIFRKVRS